MKRLTTVMVAGIVLAVSAGARPAAAQAAPAAPAADGQALYRQHCSKCHGARGTPSARMVGLYPELKALTDSAIQRLSVDSMVSVMTNGAGKDMKPFKEKMTRDEMVLVAKYVHALRTAAGT